MSTDWFELAKHVTDVRPEPEPMRWWRLTAVWVGVTVASLAVWLLIVWAVWKLA